MLTALTNNLNRKRQSITKKIEEKEKALRVEEEVTTEQPLEDIEKNKTYIYYKEQIAAAESAYLAKKEYFEEQIERLRERLENPQQKRSKKYVRLETELRILKEEASHIDNQLVETSLASGKNAAIMAKNAVEAELEKERRREEEQRQRALEEFSLRKQEEQRKEDERAKERMESAKKELAEELAALKNSEISKVDPEPVKSQKYPLPPRGGSNSQNAPGGVTWKTKFSQIETLEELRSLDIPYESLTDEEMVLHDDLEDRLLREADTPSKAQESKVSKETKETKEPTKPSKKITFAPDPLEYLLGITSIDDMMTEEVQKAIASLSPSQMPKYIAHMSSLSQPKNTIVQSFNPSLSRPFIPSAPLVQTQEVPGPLGSATLLQSTKPKMMPKQVGKR